MPTPTESIENKNINKIPTGIYERAQHQGIMRYTSTRAKVKHLQQTRREYGPSKSRIRFRPWIDRLKHVIYYRECVWMQTVTNAARAGKHAVIPQGKVNKTRNWPQQKKCKREGFVSKSNKKCTKATSENKVATGLHDVVNTSTHDWAREHEICKESHKMQSLFSLVKLHARVTSLICEFLWLKLG